MTIYAVDLHIRIHTCPADPTPHPVEIQRRIVHITPGGPCLTPVTIHSGPTTATVPCGRHASADRQCGNCRIIVTIHAVTVEHLDNDQEPATPAPIAGEAVA